MENKDIVIIALIALIIYLYWQQIQQKTLPIQPQSQELSQLKNQIQHWQTLYQKGIETSITGHQEEIQSLTENLTSSQQQNSLYQQKISDLEKQVLDIAKQKVKGKKEFQQLIEQLEDMCNNSLKEKERKWLAKEKAWMAREQDSPQEKRLAKSDNFFDKIEKPKKALAEERKEINNLLVTKNQKYRENIKKALEIIDRPLVFFYGKSEVLDYLRMKTPNN